jgi:lipoyl(octanoyl) transferase
MTGARAVVFSEPVSYDDGLRIQHEIHAARLADEIPDTVLFLQHEPVITLGRRGRDRWLRKNAAELRALGIECRTASRGGDVTYHGPGQWVLYPILKLGAGESDAHGYLYNLEETAIRALASYGVRGFRRGGMNGAWTDRGKVAAIGFHIRRWVTLHGMSFNVRGDLPGFRHIVACGLEGEPVASLETCLGRAPDMEDARAALARAFEAALGREFIETEHRATG